jgi:hypothetical protein
MNRSVQELQPFVWSGIALAIPAAWETGELDDGYALLEYGFRPVLELKTAIIRGRFSFKRHLKQLAKAGKHGPAPHIEAVQPPPEWPVFPSTIQLETFTWQGKRTSGLGLILFCHTCQRATLMQIYDRGLAEAPRIVASFRDHDKPSEPSIAVYDIQATLPATFGLTGFQFEAGRFSLVFARSQETITLWRWSPADVMLAGCGGDLATLVRQNGLLPDIASPPTRRSADNHVQWQWHRKGPRNRLRDRFRRRPHDSNHLLRIWHHRPANRILAVRAVNVEDLATFDRICCSYGIIQKENAANDAG